MGAFHGAEIPYTFGNLDRMQGFGHPLDYTEEDTALSKLMHAYWVNFIKNGDPNGEGLPAWPGKEAGGHMQFDLQSAMHDDVVDPRSVPVLEAVDRWMRARAGKK